MNMIIKLIIILLPLFICIDSFGQPQIIAEDESGNIIFANPEIIQNRVTILQKNGNVSFGFLVGFKSDTLITKLGAENYYYSLTELAGISVDVEPNNYKGLLLGSSLGFYMAGLAFLQEEDQPTAYVTDFEPFGIILLGLLSATVGGGIGYLIESGINDDEERFTFPDDPALRVEEIKRFKDFISGKKHNKKVHFTIQMSQVSTRMAELDDPDSYYYDVSSFNLLRKADITYDFFSNLSFGLAVNWFGEPRFYYSSYRFSSHNDESIYINQQYEGRGYYAVAVYKPFAEEDFQTFDWRIGFGIGVGEVDLTCTTVRNERIENQMMHTKSEYNISKSKLSYMMYTYFDLYLYESFSMGLSADYVNIDEKMEAIPELKLSERSLGNYSVGLNFSLHF